MVPTTLSASQSISTICVLGSGGKALDLHHAVLAMELAAKWIDGALDDAIAEQLNKVKTPIILVINKIDTIKVQEEILTFIAAYKDVCDFAEIVPLSALKDEKYRCAF